MVNASKHPNINLFTYSDIVEFGGIPGDYKVKIRKNARYVDEKKCTGCELCWLYCPDAAIGKDKPPKIDYKYCKGCGICANECPVKAIIMVAEGEK